MIYLGVVLLSTFFSLSCSDDSFTCKRDSDCYDGKVCSYNVCKERETLKVCGQVVKPCNCDWTPAYPGMLSKNNVCESDWEQYFACSGVCNAGYPWGTKCYCE